VVVLIAEPRLLGLMRQSLRDALAPGIELKELAKDYVGLTPRELQDRLALTALIPR
jgi:protein required for attachment to host cells